MFLRNVGNGDAFNVRAETHPLGNCRVRGAASWDEIGADSSAKIEITADVSGLGQEKSITVRWTDAENVAHQDDVDLDESALDALNPFKDHG